MSLSCLLAALGSVHSIRNLGKKPVSYMTDNSNFNLYLDEVLLCSNTGRYNFPNTVIFLFNVRVFPEEKTYYLWILI